MAYTVTEADANKDGYTTTVSPGARGTIPAEGTAEVSFVNDRTPNKGGSSADGSGTGSGSPRTGDETGLALWAALASGSMLALAAVLTLYRKRDRS